MHNPSRNAASFRVRVLFCVLRQFVSWFCWEGFQLVSNGPFLSTLPMLIQQSSRRLKTYQPI